MLNQTKLDCNKLFPIDCNPNLVWFPKIQKYISLRVDIYNFHLALNWRNSILPQKIRKKGANLQRKKKTCPKISRNFSPCRYMQFSSYLKLTELLSQKKAQIHNNQKNVAWKYREIRNLAPRCVSQWFFFIIYELKFRRRTKKKWRRILYLGTTFPENSRNKA